MEKGPLRKALIDRRISLARDRAKDASGAIQERLLASPLYRQAASVAAYCDFRGEVATGALLHRTLKDGKRLVLPRVAGEDFSLRFLAVRSLEEIALNRYGFAEPAEGAGAPCGVGEIDLFVLPGVAFDAEGRRLGMGKGCYDRALQGVERHRIAALAYEFQVIPEVPADSRDVRVGWVFTESRVIEVCNKNN